MEQKWDNLLNEEAAPGGLKGNWDPATKTYTIAKNEYLTKIAKAFGVDWKKMYEANKANLKSGNPNLVYVGEKLIISDYQGGGTTTDSSTTTTTTVASNTQTVKLKYDANALLYYAMERRLKSKEPGGDLDEMEKYGNLALYFQDVRDGKAQDVTKYNLTQADVNTFISEFEKMIAGNNDLLNKYIENGKNTTVTNIAGTLHINTSSTQGGRDSEEQKVTSGEEGQEGDFEFETEDGEEKEMDREIDTTRNFEILKSNNGWESAFKF
jgi:LysM repeat protein